MNEIRPEARGGAKGLVEAPRNQLRIEARAASGVKLSLVIPTYNEAGNLERLVERLCAVLEARLPGGYELIVVDDDSPDRTWELALKLAKTRPMLRVVRRTGEKGLSTAVVRGWQCARGEVLGVIDADLQHPPEVIAKLWEAIDGGADLAVGSRHVEGGGLGSWSLLRRALSRGAQLLGRVILPGVVGRVRDPMSGFFLVRREAIADRGLNPLGYKILLEVLGRGRIERPAEVGYVFCERTAGESKASGKVLLEYLLHLVRLRADTVPPRFLKYLAVGATGVAVDMGLLFLLGDPRALGWGLAQSKAVAVEAAILNNFLWNDVWTFGDIGRRLGGGRARLLRLAKFNAICLVGLALSVGLLTFQVDALGLNRYLANAIAIALVTFWNFFMNKAISWAVPRAQSSPAHEPLPVSPSEGPRASLPSQQGSTPKGMDMAEHEEVRLGMRVRDVEGRDLGTVVRKGENRFLCESGRITKESLIVRDEYVAVVNDGEVVLSVTHRQLMDEMRRPLHKPAFVERYAYPEPPPPRTAPVSPVTPAEVLSEHPGKARVVREEVEIRSGSAHEYEIKPDDERRARDEELPEDETIHPVD